MLSRIIRESPLQIELDLVEAWVRVVDVVVPQYVIIIDIELLVEQHNIRRFRRQEPHVAKLFG